MIFANGGSGDADRAVAPRVFGARRPAAATRHCSAPCTSSSGGGTTGLLRDANLIETRRQGRSVRHSLTPLGRTMPGQLAPVTDMTGITDAVGGTDGTDGTDGAAGRRHTPV